MPAISYLLDNFFQAQLKANKLYFPNFAATESVFIASDYGGDSGDNRKTSVAAHVQGVDHDARRFLSAKEIVRSTRCHSMTGDWEVGVHPTNASGETHF